MPSPIQTQGFGVQVMPSVNFADPRLLAPNYGDIIPNVNRGLATYGNLQQIADESKLRPIKQKMAQIQLDEAMARLAQLPVEQQLQQIQLGEAQKNAAIPKLIPGDVTIEEVVSPYDIPALDEDGVATAPMPVGDLVRVQKGTRIGAGGIETPETIRTTIKTGADRAAEMARQAATIKATEALAEQRGRDKTYESQALIQGYQDALDAGDEATAALYKSLLDRKSMAPGILPTGTVYGRQLEKTAAQIGVTMEQVQALAATPAGASAIAKLAQQQAVLKSGRSFIPPTLRLNAAEQAAFNAVSEVNAAEAAATVVAETPKGDVLPRPASKGEYDALPSGTKYIAPDGQTKIKK